MQTKSTETVVHLFKNNGRTLIGFPGLYHVVVPSDGHKTQLGMILDASTIPAWDRTGAGEKDVDPALYGVDLGQLAGIGKLLHALVQVLGDDSTSVLTGDQKQFLRNTQDAVGSARW